MKTVVRESALAMTYLFFFATGLQAATPPPSSSPLPPPNPRQEVRAAPPPALEKLTRGIYRMGEIIIDKNLRCVTFPAKINMNKGMLEYLLVKSGGKTHESLLRTEVDPYQLQVAFLLMGYEGSDKPLARQGDPTVPTGEAVEVRVMVRGTEPSKTAIDPADWIEKKVDQGQQARPKLELVYTGSKVINKQFLAQAEGSIIALYHDPAAMIDNASAGGESDKIWLVKAGTPPVGTPVTVTVRPSRSAGGLK